jgi:hypothetical protein
MVAVWESLSYKDLPMHFMLLSSVPLPQKAIQFYIKLLDTSNILRHLGSSMRRRHIFYRAQHNQGQIRAWKNVAREFASPARASGRGGGSWLHQLGYDKSDEYQHNPGEANSATHKDESIDNFVNDCFE